MIDSLDTVLFNFINSFARFQFLDTVLPFFSKGAFLWAALIAFLFGYVLYCQHRYGEAFWRVVVLLIILAFSLLMTYFLSDMLKESSNRLRPYQVIENSYHYDSKNNHWRIVSPELIQKSPRLFQQESQQGNSMPSTLAAATMAVALILALLFHKTNPWIFIIPLIVGWSSVYTGDHYPFDVVVGWIIGIVSVLVVWLLCDLFFRIAAPQKRL